MQINRKRPFKVIPFFCVCVRFYILYSSNMCRMTPSQTLLRFRWIVQLWAEACLLTSKIFIRFTVSRNLVEFRRGQLNMKSACTENSVCGSDRITVSPFFFLVLKREELSWSCWWLFWMQLRPSGNHTLSIFYLFLLTSNFRHALHGVCTKWE